MLKKRFIVAGETNVDVILRGASMIQPGREVLADDAVLTLGSASAICAVGLTRLGNDVSFVSRLGTDLWGDYCLGALRAAGVDTTHVGRTADMKTGLTVSIAAGGDRALMTHLGAIDSLTEADLPDSVLEGATHLHVSSFFLQSRLRHGLGGVFARARAIGLSTSLDPGCDPQAQWDGGLQDAIDEVDVFLPNELELAGVSRSADAADGLRALAGRRALVVTKLGHAGSVTLDRGHVIHAPALRIVPIDTTGAGDSFNAGFLHGFVRDEPLLDCLMLGNACGALSTRSLGGTTAQPTLDEAMRFLRGAIERR